MNTPLNVLLVEDREEDALLVVHELKQAGFDPAWRRVDTEADYIAALDPALDVILADFNLPGWSSTEAMTILQTRGWDIPFIIVSGTIGEENAVAAMRDGATDYLLKDRLARLGSAVRQTVEARRLREERRTIEAERERADLELRESEERYRDLVENSRELICTHDLDGRLLSVNEAATRMTGYSREQLTRMSLLDLVVPGMGKSFAAYLAEIRSTGHAHGVMKIRTAGGEVRYWGYDNTLRTSGVEEPIVRGMARDVTDRILAQKELQTKTEELEAYFTRALDLFCIADTNGILRRLNKQWELTLGYPLYELLGTNFMDLVHPDDVEATLEKVAALERKEEVINFVNRYRHKDASWRWIEWRAQSDGRVIYAAARDITARIETERSIRESEARYREMFAANPHPMWVYDLETLAFLAVNDAAVNHYGYSRDEFLAMTIRDIRPPEEIPRLLADLSERRQPLNHAGEWLHRLRDGRVVEVDLTSHTMKYEGRDAVLVVSQDITERRRAEEELRLTQSTALEKEARFRQIFTTVGDAILITDAETKRIVDVNEAALQMYGYTREEFLSLKLADITTEPELAAAAFEKTARGEINRVPLGRHRREDGSVFPVEIAVGTFFLEGRQLICEVVRDITERVAREEELRRNEERYRELVNGLHSGIVVHAADTTVLLSNPQASAILGLTEDQMRGKAALDPAWRFVREDGTDVALEEYPVNLVLASREPLEDYVMGLHLPGHSDITWVLVNGFPRFHPDGELDQAVIDFVDITKRRQGEEELRASEARLAEAQRTARLGNWDWDMANDELRSSDEIYHILGLVPEAFGTTYEAFRSSVHPDDRKRVDDAVNRTLNKFEPHDIEYRIVHPDGTELIVHEQAEVNRDENGAPVRMAGTVQDVTERMRDREALRESEERFHLLADNAPDVIYRYRTTPPHGFEYVSPACEQLTGYTPEEYYADPNLGVKIVHPDDRHELVERRLNPEKYLEPMVVRWITKEGGTVWTEQRAKPVFDAAGQLVAVEGIARDISETRRLGERLRQSERLESVGQLAGGVAHDFNNLLTVIMGNAEILLEGYEAGDPAAEEIEQIAATAKRAAVLTRQLLAFSRKLELDPRVVDLNAILTETRKMLARLIGEQIEMRWVLDPELGRVLVDPGQIEQVIVNLAVNGRDAMPRGGTLIVETANVDLDLTYTKAHGMMPPGRYVKLAVSDSGSGMDQETLSRVFEPFFTTKELGHGTGLGLATVYGIVKQSGGFIWAYSEPNKGTTFKIYLPRVEEKAETAKPPLPETDDWRGGGETILLVEDETPLRKLVRGTLEKNGYHVLDAADGVAALQLWKLHQEEIHLLLSDVVIPGMSGPALASRLRQDSPRIRTLFFSGYTDDAMAQLGITRENFLEKPFALPGLLTKVRKVLDSEDGGA